MPTVNDGILKSFSLHQAGIKREPSCITEQEWNRGDALHDFDCSHARVDIQKSQQDRL